MLDPRRIWVCPACETAGIGVHPLRCWWCERPALDGGCGTLTINALLIRQRLDRARQGAR